MVSREDFLQKHRIFVEGTADQVFVRDILFELYNIELTKKELEDCVINVKGMTNISKFGPTFNEIKNGKRVGGSNLVIFDADYEIDGGGYEARTRWLEELKNSEGIDFDFFFFTDQNLKEGTIENMLESCIQPTHSGIFDWWGGFEHCVDGMGKGYTMPARKSKIYLYLECLYGETRKEKDKIKDPNRNYLEKDKWVFDLENNLLLRRLKDFLDKNLL